MQPSRVITAAAGTDKPVIFRHFHSVTLFYENVEAVLMGQVPRPGHLNDPAMTQVILE